MEAVHGELVWRDVASELACVRALGHQVSDECSQMLLRAREVLPAMKESGDQKAI